MYNAYYNDYYIDSNYIPGYYSVFYSGEEILFETIEEAKQFIDSIKDN